MRRRNLAIKQILGFYEKNVRNILTSIHGDCFYDVGANVGFYSLLLRRNFRHVHGVEPVSREHKAVEARSVD